VDDGVLLSSQTAAHITVQDGTRDRSSSEGKSGHNVVVDGAPKPWKVDTEHDGLRETLKDFEQMWQQSKEKRIQVLRTLSNPWPEAPPHRQYKKKESVPSELPEPDLAPISHETFRQRLLEATSDKKARQVLRAQLLRCENPKDIRRVVATALVQGKATRQHISALHEPIMRALYRCRHQVDDHAIFDCLSGIYSRFRIYGVPFDPQFLMLGLKFAARTRSLKGMKKYLKALRERGLKMTSNVFRAIIAKFSIGHRGLGEIRNGRWRRSELLQVCIGFEDCKHLPPHQQYHLETFLDRSDWQYLHGWIAVLARCKHSDAVWAEWLLWKQSEARTQPKRLASTHNLSTTKLRGDYWFLEQMTFSGGLVQAWAILAETGLNFKGLSDRIKFRLLEDLEHCTVPYRFIRDDLLRKYDIDLAKIERAFGVRWVSISVGNSGDEDGAEGYHELVEDQEEVMERLGADDWKLEEDYGYPYDEPIVPLRERGLHDAVEMGLAEFASPETVAKT